MKVFKLIVTLIILCLIALFVYQNMDTWKQLIQFKLNLYLYKTDANSPPSLALYVIMAISALIGFIVGLAAMLKPYFNARRLLRRERSEKKQVEEKLTAKETRPEPVPETPAPAVSGE